MSKQKKPVLIIGINFFPEPTGIGKYTGEFAFHLQQKGFQVKVITAFPYYPHWKVFAGYKNLFFKTEDINGVSVTRCPLYVPSSLNGMKRILQDFTFFSTAFFYLLGQIVTGKKYSLVFVPSPSFMSGFLGVFYRFFYSKAKFVYHIQDLQVDAAEELGMIKSQTLLVFLKKLEGFILSRASYVTTISVGMLRKILQKPYPVKKHGIFPNWVDFGQIFPKEPELARLEGLGFPLDKRIVFYSGAVGEKQGLEMVLEAAANAMVALPDLAFVIAGSGPYVKTLAQMADEKRISNIYFIPLQPSVIFNELLNHAFIHLVIQKDKAGDLLLPSKLTNILAVGGLCIVTASPGTSLSEIVAGNQIGIVIPPENSQAFWLAIQDIATNDSKCDNIKKAAAVFAKSNLQKDAVIDAFLESVGV